jgi:hypothetical protein
MAQIKRFAKRGKAPSSAQCNSFPRAASGIVEPNNLHNIEQKYSNKQQKKRNLIPDQNLSDQIRTSCQN